MSSEKIVYPPKITRPQSGKTLARERLFAQLKSACEQHPLVWISAPGGSGKTTLISSYLESRKIKSIWYQVDEGDVDLATFFHYMGQAGKKASPRRKKSLPSLTPEYLQGLSIFTRRFFEEIISRLGEGGVIVLDNFQLLKNESELVKLLPVITEAISGQLTLIIISRNTVPDHLVGLSAKGLLYKIEEKSIRFSEDEWLAVPQSQSITKDKKRLLSLHEKMGGWISGLMLCQNIDIDTLDKGDEIDAVNEPLFNYFAHEFFYQLDEQSQRVLTCCSYLYHFNEDTARIISGVEKSGAILRKLLNKNYFILRQGKGTYTLHPLFQSYLQNEVSQLFDEEKLYQLKNTSAEMLVENGEYELAADLYIQLQAWDSLAAFTIKYAGRLFAEGRTVSLQSWLTTLSSEIKIKNTWLLYWDAALNSFKDIPKSLDDMSQVFDQFLEQEDMQGARQTWIFVMQSINSTWMETQRIPEWLNNYKNCGEVNKENVPIELEAQIIANLAVGYMLYGQEPESTKYYLNQIDKIISQHKNEELDSILINRGLFVTLVLGHTNKAKKYLAQLNSLSDTNSFSPLGQMDVVANKLMGESFVGDPSVALMLYEQGQQLAEDYGIFLFEGIFQITTLMAALSMSNEAQAKFHIQRSDKIPPFPIMNKTNIYWGKAQMAIFQGHYDEAVEACEIAIKLLTEEQKIPTYAQIIKFTHIEAVYGQGKSEEAQRLLQIASDEADKLQMPSSQIRAHLLKAHFAMDAHDEKNAKLHISNMFKLGKKYGMHLYCGWVPGKLISWACHKALEWNIESSFVKNYVHNLNHWLIPPDMTLREWPWPVRIYTMGHFRIELDNGKVLGESKQDKKPLQLLQRLMIRSGSATVSELSEDLYSEQPNDKHSSLLRKHLHRLRTLLNIDAAILRDGDMLHINRQFCWIDVDTFNALSLVKTKAARDDALALYQGEYLSQVNIDNFDLLAQREQLRGTYLRNALEQIESLDKSDAIELCHQVLLIEPLSEIIYQKLMTLYQSKGQNDLALSTYEQCQRLLQQELGVEPMLETRRIAGLEA